jgi:N-acetyl-anhydromuramyl-L-alanine amidase AmpD
MEEKEGEAVTAQPVEVTDVAALREEAAVWQMRAAYLQEQAQRAETARAELAQRVLALESQVSSLEAFSAELQTRLAQTEALLDQTRSAAAVLPAQVKAVARPVITDIVDDLPHSTDPTNQYHRRSLSQIRYLTLHHTGSDDLTTTPQQLAEFAISDPKHQWPGIGFHFFIAADGTIYQTNHLETACYHVVQNNADSVGIVLAGRFSGSSPRPAQLASTAALLAWLLQELRLPLDAIAGHSEFPGQATDCPGTDWLSGANWKQSLLEETGKAAQSARRGIYHYVLFWQTDTAWAEADWKAAARYIARFRPTVGFSPQEASQAENVTIIGGPSGVSENIEEMLRAAGCRVQRVAGKTARQTRALLQAMAKDGRRFLSP